MNSKSLAISAAIAFVLILGGAGVLLISQSSNPDSQQTNLDTSSNMNPQELPANNNANQTALAGSPESEQSDTASEDAPGELDQASDDNNASNYTIDTKMFEFSIDQIKAKPGETINVTLTNSAGSHDFVIDELGVNSGVINPGQTAEFSFTIPDDASGKTFAFYCSVGNHRAQGMEGSITVQ